MQILDIISRLLFIFLLSYYLLTNLQWYNYSYIRIFTKHHKKNWHIYYLFVPIIIFLATQILSCINDIFLIIFYIYLFLIFLPIFIKFTIKLDKKLVFTQRIIRAFIIIFGFVILNEILLIIFNQTSRFVIVSTFIIACIIGFIISAIFEIMLFKNYEKLAKNKLKNLKNLKIIAITGSYGKTSIKNFLYTILKEKYNVYATPRSVNTLKGIVGDINNNLDESHEFYIVEAGARNKGDILEIAKLLNHNYAIIAKVGDAHIEYFKNIQTTLDTKFELLESSALLQIFVHKENEIPKNENNKSDMFKSNLAKITKYPLDLRNINATLENTTFELKINNEWEDFETNILGRFNVDNLCVCIMMANALNIKMEKIKKVIKKLESTPHRLQKIITNNKFIIDDSFNGNIEGMNEAIRLSALYNGRKIIVTPGLVEHSDKDNANLAKKIDSVFDLAIITGDLNAKILSDNIQNTQKIILKDKSQLQELLKTFGKDNDLVLFANDAPNYI